MKSTRANKVLSVGGERKETQMCWIWCYSAHISLRNCCCAPGNYQINTLSLLLFKTHFKRRAAAHTTPKSRTWGGIGRGFVQRDNVSIPGCVLLLRRQEEETFESYRLWTSALPAAARTPAVCLPRSAARDWGTRSVLSSLTICSVRACSTDAAPGLIDWFLQRPREFFPFANSCENASPPP